MHIFNCYVFPQGKVYMEKHILPPGVIAVPVERCEWLNVVVDCTGPAFVSVESSRTDYLLLTEAGATELLSKGVNIESILDILPTVVGFYELKTPKAIKDEKPSCRRQAILEFVAGTKMCRIKGRFNSMCPDFIQH
jgi:hypothetical protein